MKAELANEIAEFIQMLARQIAIVAIKENEAQKILPNIQWPNEALEDFTRERVQVLAKWLEKI